MVHHFVPPVALTYNSDVHGSPEDPVVCGLSVTEIHPSVQRPDPADVQQAGALAGVPALLRHSLDALERGETRRFSLNRSLGERTGSLLHHLALHLVPNDVRVVAAVQTWAGNRPSFIHEQILHPVLRLETSQTFSLQHLQLEGLIPAAGHQKKKKKKR